MDAFLHRRFFPSGPTAEQPDRDADHDANQGDLDDQEQEPGRDPDEREEEYQQDLPQQDCDETRCGNAENRLHSGQAPLEGGDRTGVRR